MLVLNVSTAGNALLVALHSKLTIRKVMPLGFSKLIELKSYEFISFLGTLVMDNIG